MAADASTSGCISLADEWERIALLAQALEQSRRGQQPSQSDLDSLRQLQSRVELARQADGPWAKIVPPGLSCLEYDVLACVVAPEAAPRIGWTFQMLQPGAATPYPTPSFLRELLAIHSEEECLFFSVFSPSSRLRSSGLIDLENGDPYQPVRPATTVTSRLLGWPPLAGNLPGAMEVKLRESWENLVLPEDRIAMLREFLLWIRQKPRVVHEWGGCDCGGPVALFSGPSGTGKTLAAAVLAAELRWPLYKVDLGKLVSKYIGETEKNLNRLFDAAHGREMILQFDEADSLFSKRGEVKEARDRYANMEVSHLLARVEQHEGPVILTTNLRKHLDPAFARRFQIVVDFPRPDAAARARLWQLLLPPRAPRSADVDVEFLGAAANLTGGNIRNAALHAAYLAAGNGNSIGLGHIALSVWRELGKDGRELSPADLGPLASYLP